MLGKSAVKIPIYAEDKTGRAFKSARNNMTALGKAGATLSRSLSTIGVGFGVGIAASTALAAKSLISAAAQFEKAAKEVNSLMNLDDAGFKEFTKDLQTVSLAIGVDLIDTTKAAYQAISAGVPRENLMSFLTTASKTAIAGVTDTETAIKALLAATENFGVDGGRAADVLFSTVKEGITTFEELAGAFYLAAPAAGEIGMTFEELAAAGAALTTKTTPINQAMTQVRSTITALMKPTAEMEKLFGLLGVANGRALIKARGYQGALNDLTAGAKSNNLEMAKVFSRSEAQNAVFGLTGKNADLLTEKLNSAANSYGNMALAYEINNDTMLRASEKLKTAWQNLGATIAMTDAWAGTVDGLTLSVDKLNAALSDSAELKVAVDIKSAEHDLAKVKNQIDDFENANALQKLLTLVTQPATFGELAYRPDEFIASAEGSLAELQELQIAVADINEIIKATEALINEPLIADGKLIISNNAVDGATDAAELITKALASIRAEVENLAATPTARSLREELEQTLSAAQAAYDAGNVLEYDEKVKEAVTTQRQLNTALQKQVDLKKEINSMFDEMLSEGTPTMNELFSQMEPDSNSSTAWEQWRDSGLNAQQMLMHGMETAADGMTDALLDFVTTGKMNFSDMVSSMLKDIARLLIYQKVVSPFVGGIGGMFAGGGGTIPAPPTAEVFHKGGVVPRYHSGGIGGLKPDERPAILQVGEEVLTASDPRHRKNIQTSAGGPPVNITFRVDAIDAQSFDQAMASRRRLIVGMVDDAMNRRGKRGASQ